MLERPAGIEDRLGPSLAPGTLQDNRYRLASVASRSSSDLVFNALDERSRQRIRLRVTAQPIVPELAALRHPAFPAVLRQGEVRARESRWAYAVLEWFDGAPLALPDGPIRGDEAVRAWATRVADLLDALEHLHGASGRAHGDLGLHSLWEGRDGALRVLDASAPDGVVGSETVPYASPERLRGQPRDARSDVYSVAAIAWALASGAPPFGVEPQQARTGHLLWRLPEHPALPATFQAVLREAMEKAAEQRFASAGEMKAAIEQAIRAFDGPGGDSVPSGRRAEVLDLPYFDDDAERLPPAPGELDDPISQDLLSLDRSMEPPPVRIEPRPRRRRKAAAAPVLQLLLSSVGVALSVFAWSALIGLLAAVVSGWSW